MRLAILAVLLSSSAALAQPALTSSSATCAKVQETVARNGSALITYAAAGYNRANIITTVLSFGEHGFDRVVHDARFCLPRHDLTPIWVPTRDNAQCFAGYTCSEGGGSGGGRHSR